MNVLVTGGTGFMGRFLCPALRARGWDVTALGSKDADLTRPGSLDRFDHARFDKVFHLASWTQAGDFCLHHPGEQWIMNQQINTNVLGWWAAHQRQAKFISIGTSCSYPVDLPMEEDNYLKGTPFKDLYTYAMTKRMLLVGQTALRQQYSLNHLTVVPSTLYGPDYHMDGKQLHFIFDLVRKILAYKHSGTPVVLWGDGHQRRELVYVDDFIEALLALDQNVSNDVVNIGAGEDHSIRDFAALICRIAGVDAGVITYDTGKYVGARSKVLSNKKLDALLPGRRRTTLEQGLKQTIQWMEEHHVCR
jgi:GDP-L-fucose synthase